MVNEVVEFTVETVFDPDIPLIDMVVPTIAEEVAVILALPFVVSIKIPETLVSPLLDNMKMP